jgi:hypothetical protein
VKNYESGVKGDLFGKERKGAELFHPEGGRKIINSIFQVYIY